jgi:hypothetical protein
MVDRAPGHRAVGVAVSQLCRIDHRYPTVEREAVEGWLWWDSRGEEGRARINIDVYRGSMRARRRWVVGSGYAVAVGNFEILTPGIGVLRRYRTTHGCVLAIVGSGRSEAASCGPGASSGSNIWLFRLKIQTSISSASVVRSRLWAGVSVS